MKIPLINIHNQGRLIYLFTRDEQGRQKIIQDKSFFPYYYEVCDDGDEISYDGKKLKKMLVSSPKEVKELRSNKSYEADIIYTHRILIDQIEEIQKCPIKYSFIDIEVLTNQYPNPFEAKYPISCIACSNSFTDEIISFYLGDYKSEYEMIEAFITYLKKEKFDLWLFWNGDSFDMPYILNRIPEFSKKVSPIEMERYGQKDLFYPAGISIVDYMLIDKKFTLNRKFSYALDSRLQEVLGRGKQIKKLDFSKLSKDIKIRCENDVRDMVQFEEKMQYIPILDGLRRLTKTTWEDYIFNSRYIDQLLLTEANKQKIRLPMKPTKENMNIDEEFEGAFRKVITTGSLFEVGGYDLSGAYLNTIIDLCLDPANIRTEQTENSIPVNITDRKTNEIIKTLYVIQNKKAILPLVATKLLGEKNKFKELLKGTDPNSLEFKDREEKYKAWKSLSLSSWGVIGNKYFRYYDVNTTALITSTVRDLLYYTIESIESKGYKVHYIDTDGLIIDDKDHNIINLLNETIQEWSNKRFKRPSSITFEYEGKYKSLFILALCRYKGFLETKQGIEEKTVGIEAKRKDSTVFVKSFQTELLKQLLDKNYKKEVIINWIREQIIKIKEQPLQNISFPCKLARPKEDYKNLPIFIRALESTPNYTKQIGENFYYVFMQGKDNAKKQLVMAFDEDNYSHIDRNKVDWNMIIIRNIIMKIDTIFEAMKWDLKELGWEKTKTKYKELEVSNEQC